MNIAIVDIGSNTIRLNIYHVEKNEYSILFTKKYTASLASYFEDGQLSEEGIKTLKKTLKSIQNATSFVTLESIHYFATASLRNISNQDEIIAQVKKEMGIAINLLSQEEEARLGHIGIEEVYGKTDGLSIDIGGGSTEISIFEDEKVIADFNFSEGSLSLYKRYVDEILPTLDEYNRITEKVKKLLKKKEDEKVDKVDKFDTLIGIGGSIRVVGKVIQKVENTDSATEFTVDQLKSVSKKLLNHDKNTLIAIFKVSPDRIHTITPGVIVLLEVCKWFKVKKILISNKGLREGYLVDYLQKSDLQLSTKE
ncbi:Ppx/GppA phosphatase family protein [Streptococcus parauberis]|uniref:Ppx/GppA phosphatase family protein n=1 Tax=Streptococcus parauberis TaxID=1348 RepID=UPI0002BAD8F3|nr:exopolyphosphatase [Streptococcus parauberis]EMF48940.1 Exopolyphosphatase [Streptococcus parauberis KRS-02109]UWM87260.1 exopolyphosphatase [Streptococcus parauberis]UWM89233.1 exopolyphosphatase [Streptococcus parauberis]WEM59959.1 exopolyphosphatase [Streptococcus parauberis]